MGKVDGSRILQDRKNDIARWDRGRMKIEIGQNRKRLESELRLDFLHGKECPLSHKRVHLCNEHVCGSRKEQVRNQKF